MRGDREALARRVRHQLQCAAHLAGGESAGLAVAGGAGEVGDLDRVLAVGVGDVGDLAAGAEHLGRRTRTPGVSVMVRAGPSRWVSQYRLPRTTTALARPVSSTEMPSTCWAAGTWYVRRPARGPAQPHVQRARGRRRGQVVDDPQVAGALVDDAGAVARRVPGVEGVVVGVAAQVGAVVGTGVEVADALVVGEEGDTAVDEHRGSADGLRGRRGGGGRAARGGPSRRRGSASRRPVRAAGCR